MNAYKKENDDVYLLHNTSLLYKNSFFTDCIILLNAKNQLFMIKKNAQLINTIFIVIGGGIIIYTISGDEKSKYLQIVGLIIIMFGLYRATNHWSYTKDDHLEDTNKKEEEL